ncbi:MAG TPA: substrate-binding domain-containing protein [Phycisphaerae bacterium]|nr:substrate-binding domain-containing protein [Phycisphaerae bacterium]
MRRSSAGAFLLGGLWLAVAGCTSMDEPPSPDGARPLKLAVIPKATMHVFWKSIHAGARKAERELPGVSILWQGPAIEDDRGAQISLVETFVQARVDGIVLAPLDDKALIAPVRAARAAGIPTVIIDSALADPQAYVSFVATDNFQGGVMAGRHLAKILNDTGKVVLLRYQVGSASNENRERGFLDEMARHGGIEVVSSNQYGGPTVETAMKASEALLAKFGPGEVDGVFCVNEPLAWGMLRALVAAGRAGQIKFVAFDTSGPLLEALKKGQVDALVVQDPIRMGYEGVRSLVAHLRGEKVEKRIDTGVVLVTRENLSDGEIDRLVHPPLE